MSALAVVLVLGAAVAHAAWNIIAHGVSRSGIPFLWCAAVAATVIWMPVAVLTGGVGGAPGADGGDVVAGFALGIGVSALLHVAYMLVLQRGYALGNLSTVYATARGTGPLLTVVVAIAFLGERPSALALAGIAAIVAGVVAAGLVDRRPRDPERRRGIDPGIAFGLLTGVGIAAYTVWDTWALRTWSLNPVAFMVGCTALEILLYTAALSMGAPGRRIRSVVPLFRREWRRLIAFGVLSPLAYILVLTAVTIAPVSLVAPMREVSVVLVSLFAAFVLREGRPTARVAASVVVAGGVVLLAL